MPKRRQLARERLEMNLVQLLLECRNLILISGLILLVFAFDVLLLVPQAGIAILLPAILLLLVGNSYQVVVHFSRWGAWIGS